MDEIRKNLNAVKQEVDYNVFRILRRVGEKCVTEAKDNGNYQNITHNLRNSISYAIIKNGLVVERNAVRPESNKAIDDVAMKYPRGYVLVVVAGMNYALYVESKGYNVLSTAEQLAEREVPRLLNEIFR
ncbi:hypothetical protein ACQ1R0_05860 [Ornithobacterium rhinotracheale]